MPAVILRLFKDRCVAIAGRNLLLAKELCRLLAGSLKATCEYQVRPYTAPRNLVGSIPCIIV
jgi:hypothetical protein